MSCQYPIIRSRAARRWHLLRCPDCRLARSADAVLDRGLQRLQAQATPADGLARTLAAVGIAPAARAPRKDWKIGIRRCLMPTGAVSALLAAGWLYAIDIDPRVTIPTPVMPSPNAFDIFLKAGIPEHQCKDLDTAIDAKSHKILIYNGRPCTDAKGVVVSEPNTRAAALPGMPSGGAPAGAGGPGTPVGWKSSIVFRDGTPGYETDTIRSPTETIVKRYVIRTFTTEEKEAVLREYAPSLTLLRQGLKCVYLAPPMRSSDTLLPYLAEDRALARLLELEAQVREAHGDLNGAVNSRLDAMQLGAMMPHGSTVIGKLVGIACEAIGRHQLWQQVDRLDAAQARAAARRMEQIVQLHVPIADTMQEEKRYVQAVFMHIFRNRRWRMNYANSLGDINPQTLASTVGNYVKLLPYSKRRMMDDWTNYMDAHIRDARLPYCSRQFNTGEKEDEILTRHTDPLTGIFAPVFFQAGFQDSATCEVQDRLLMTLFALRAYQQEHGAYPDTLAALVPGYLTTVPQDPFVGSQPLRYRRAGDRFVLYSVGPDGKDDQGAPIDNAPSDANPRMADARASRSMKIANAPKEQSAVELATEREKKRYGIKQDSKGDIVAGVNIRSRGN